MKFKIIIPILLMLLMLGSVFAALEDDIPGEKNQGNIEFGSWWENLIDSLFSIAIPAGSTIKWSVASDTGFLVGFDQTVTVDLCNNPSIIILVDSPTGALAASSSKIIAKVDEGDTIQSTIRVKLTNKVLGTYTVNAYGYCHGDPFTGKISPTDSINNVEIVEDGVPCEERDVGLKYCVGDTLMQNKIICVDGVEVDDRDEVDCPVRCDSEQRACVTDCLRKKVGSAFCEDGDLKQKYIQTDCSTETEVEEDCPSNAPCDSNTLTCELPPETCPGRCGICGVDETDVGKKDCGVGKTCCVEENGITDEQSCIDAGKKWYDNKCYSYCEASDSPTYSMLASIFGMEQSLIVLPGAECTGTYDTFVERDELYDDCWLQGECVECVEDAGCNINNCKTNECDTDIGHGWCWCSECDSGYEPDDDKSACVKETIPIKCSERTEEECSGKCHWIEGEFSIDWSAIIGIGWNPLGIAGLDWSTGQCANDIVPIELDDIEDTPSSDLVNRVCENSDWCESKKGFKVRCLDADKIEEDYDVDIQGFYDEIEGFFDPGEDPGICVAIPKAEDLGIIEELKATCVWEGKIGEPCRLNLFVALIIGLAALILIPALKGRS